MQDYYSFTLDRDEAEGSFLYEFTTRTGAIYAVNFCPDDYDGQLTDYPALLQHGCGFSVFRNNSNGTEPFDRKIKATVVHIVHHFFETINPDALLLFHYDDTDGKQHKRSINFTRW